MRRQAIIHKPYDVGLDEIPLPHPLGDFELLVRTEVSALSPGTETRIYTGSLAERFSYRVRYPFALGYNSVARVVAIGSQVKNYQPGQRVLPECDISQSMSWLSEQQYSKGLRLGQSKHPDQL